MSHHLSGSAVTVFCGGRGAASLAASLVGQPDVHLSLIVNGYDNGLSTGALRRFLPGMLGVSDFRKNLRHHLDPTDPHQGALLHLLDQRLPHCGADGELADVIAALHPDSPRDGVLAGLRPDVRQRLAEDLDRFERHRSRRAELAGRAGLDLADCSVGNLLVAGAYLRLGRDFNRAVAEVADLVDCPLDLLNVTDGEDAHLVAVKEDGELLADEAQIVAPQSDSPIRHLFLLARPLRPGELTGLAPGDLLAALRERSVDVALNPAAADAVADADVLVYGPGTLHSSLLPTYLTPGLGERVRAGRARARVLMLNVQRDHDARSMTATDLVDSTLAALGDPDNLGASITHVLHQARPSSDSPAVSEAVRESGRYRGTRWIAADLERGVHSGVHDGDRAVALLGSLLQPTARAERA